MTTVWVGVGLGLLGSVVLSLGRGSVVCWRLAVTLWLVSVVVVVAGAVAAGSWLVGAVGVFFAVSITLLARYVVKFGRPVDDRGGATESGKRA